MKIASVDGAVQQGEKRSMAFRSTQRAATVAGGPPSSSPQSSSARNYIKTAGGNKGGMLLLLTTAFDAPLSAVGHDNTVTVCTTSCAQPPCESENFDRGGSDLVEFDEPGKMYTPDECARLCAAAKDNNGNNKCVGFVTGENSGDGTGRCWLKTSWTAETAKPATGADSRNNIEMTQACRDELANSPEPICPIYFGYKGGGSGTAYKARDATTGESVVLTGANSWDKGPMEACRILCAADPNCGGFNLSANCWLLTKSDFQSNSGFTNMGWQTAVLMTETCREKITAKSPCLLEESTNMNTGTPLGADMALNLDECKKQCAKDDDCEGLVHKTSTNVCSLQQNFASIPWANNFVAGRLHSNYKSLRMTAACRAEISLAQSSILEPLRAQANSTVDAVSYLVSNTVDQTGKGEDGAAKIARLAFKITAAKIAKMTDILQLA